MLAPGARRGDALVGLVGWRSSSEGIAASAAASVAAAASTSTGSCRGTEVGKTRAAAAEPVLPCIRSRGANTQTERWWWERWDSLPSAGGSIRAARLMNGGVVLQRRQNLRALGWYGGCSQSGAVPVQGPVAVSRAGSGGLTRVVRVGVTAAAAAAAARSQSGSRRERCAAGRAAWAKSSTGIAAATKTPVGVQQAPPAEWGLQRKRTTGPGSLAHNWCRQTWRTLGKRIRDPGIKKKKKKKNKWTASAQKRVAECEPDL